MTHGSTKRGSLKLQTLEAKRRQNMRQLLQRTLRIVSSDVLQGLHARGYVGLRSTHTTLLSNIDLAGSTVTVAAERAGITKQAMGRLASELEEAGYICAIGDPKDARARVLQLTDAGQRLMLDSLEVMAELERRYASEIGPNRLSAILNGLSVLVDRSRQTDASGPA